MQHWRNNHISRCFSKWKSFIDYKRLKELAITLQDFDSSDSDDEIEKTNTNSQEFTTTEPEFPTPSLNSSHKNTKKQKKLSVDSNEISKLMRTSTMVVTPKLPSNNPVS